MVIENKKMVLFEALLHDPELFTGDFNGMDEMLLSAYFKRLKESEAERKRKISINAQWNDYYQSLVLKRGGT